MNAITRRRGAFLLCAFSVAAVAVGAAATRAGAKSDALRSLLRSAISLDAANETITLPLHQGTTASGARTWYVVIDSSSKADASRTGVNFAPRLKNALGTRAVQHATLRNSSIVFPGTVSFTPKRVVVPSATGFPPTKVVPGAVGDKRYSPLVTTDDSIVLDAPQVANATGRSDSVTNLDVAHKRVTLKLLRGWFDGASVLYVRTDASAQLVAALEGSTYAPNLTAAPGLGSDASSSARSAIIPVINGARSGAGRQGLQSTLLGGGRPAQHHAVAAGCGGLHPGLGPSSGRLERRGDQERQARRADIGEAGGLRRQGRAPDERREGTREREPRGPEGDRVYLDLLDGRDRLDVKFRDA